MADEPRVRLGKSTIDAIKHRGDALYKVNSERIGRIHTYSDIYKMNWDFNPPEGDWVQELPSPEPHNAIKGIVRLMVGTVPSIKVMAEAADVTYREYAEEICKMLLRLADRRGPWLVAYDLAMSASLFAEGYVKVANVEDNVQFLKAQGNKALSNRYRRLKDEKPFLFKAYNPANVFPEWSDLGLESVTLRIERPADEVAHFWGEAAVEGANTVTENSPDLRQPHVVFWEYHGHDYRCVWIEGSKENALVAYENKLGFIPWAGSIVEGSSLFESEEDQRLPILYPVFQSGYWHAQSYADSIMYSLALSLGKLPQLKAKLNDPEADISELIDWSTPLGVMRLAINEEAEMFDKKVIDESLQIASNMSGSRMNDMLIPKQVLGSSPENVMAFASLNLLVQAGRLPLVPIQRMTGVIMGQMLEIPFLWAKARNQVYRLPAFDRPLVIDPSEYENVSVDVEIKAQFAQDDAQRVAVAANAIAAQLWSQERGMEYTGVEEPLKERAKIADDIKRRSEQDAALQAEAMQIAQNATSLVSGMGAGGLVHPSQVEYRPGRDMKLCGNCAFFQGVGVPCKIVDAAINAFFTCNQWQPTQQLQQAPPSAAPGAEQPPPLTNPNLAQGGGGLTSAIQAPALTRELTQGRDRGGNPLTGGQSLPLG